MASKPASNESKKPASSEEVRRAVGGRQEAPQARQAPSAARGAPAPATATRTAPTAAEPAPAAPSGFARYTVPSHLGSATVTDSKGNSVVLEGGKTGEMSVQDAERIGATLEGEAPARTPLTHGGTVDEHGSTRPESIPKKSPPAASATKSSAKTAEGDEEEDEADDE